MRARLLVALAALLLPSAVAGQEAVEYYALDAIGSVRVVFDANGNVKGRADYTPFGVQLDPEVALPVERFGGLVRDGEAGLDYAKARSYQVRTGRFSTVDPIYAGMFEPQLWNRYSYALNRPLNMVDPSGLNPDPVPVSCPEDKAPCTASVDVEVTGTAGPANVNLDQPITIIIDVGGLFALSQQVTGGGGTGGTGSANSTVSPLQLGIEWLTGRGPRERQFGDGDRLTEELKKHSHIEEQRQRVRSSCKDGTYSANYRLDGLQGVPKYLNDYSVLMTAGVTGNLAVTYLGSYRMSYTVSGSTSGTASVQFNVSNSSSLGSALRPPVLGYHPLWIKHISEPISRGSGPFSTTTQQVRWTETVICGG